MTTASTTAVTSAPLGREEAVYSERRWETEGTREEN
jgi:hypothetical protein